MLASNALRKPAVITPDAFSRFLEWLDDGTDSRGETYLEIRRRLVAYFERRNRPLADDLADETLNRAARALAEEGSIAVRPPARYCYVVARFVLLEDVRRGRRLVSVEESGEPVQPLIPDREALAADEARLSRLDTCLDRLAPAQREIVVEYYRDVRRERIDRRRRLAERLGITVNALSIRAWRIRNTLQTCLGGGGR